MARLEQPELISESTPEQAPPIAHTITVMPVRESRKEKHRGEVTDVYLTRAADVVFRVNTGKREAPIAYFTDLDEDQQRVVAEAFRIITAAAK